MAREVTPTQGKNVILMFRKLKESAQEEATKLALQIEHTLQYERENDSQMTKDGAVPTSGGLTVTVEMEALISDDPASEMLNEAFMDDDVLEVWEVDLSAPHASDPNKYKAKYMRGKLTNWESPANVEENQTLSTSINVEGRPQNGYATMNDDQIAEITYAFRDTTPVGGSPRPGGSDE